MITIGHSGAHPVTLDLEVFLRTRLLIQASSGAGKSYLMRKLAEQLYSRVQTFIIDREGEFRTLREKFSFLLFGPEGDAPVAVQHAALLAEKLLEIKASAIFDISEMRSDERHLWVRTFLDAMLDSPKKLWHPVVVMVDEAHEFCPEKGAGESQAFEAMAGLATRGRKRGFCAIFATQRLSKLKKDAAAELLNKIIGQTNLDIDRESALRELGIGSKKEKLEVSEGLRKLEPGNFHAVGRAISQDRIVFKVDRVETHHPEAGASKYTAAEQPASSQVKELLAKLGDIPKQAEQKVKTEAELRARIRELEAELRKKPTVAAPDPAAIEKAVQAAIKRERMAFSQWSSTVGKAADVIQEQLLRINEHSIKLLEKHLEDMQAPVRQETPASVPSRPTSPTPAGSVPPWPPRPSGKLVNVSAYDGDGHLSSPQRAILNALGELEAIGRSAPSRSWTAFLAGVSPNSSGFEKNVSTLRTRGLIIYPQPDKLSLTGEGRKHVAPDRIINRGLDSTELQARVEALLSSSQAQLLRILANKYPAELTREDLAASANVSPESSGFEKNLSTLKSRELALYPGPGLVRAADWLFV